MSDENDQEVESSLTIGALSRATGVPVETLRTWERRYGFPDPARNDAGHRIYSPADVERIRLIDRALQTGNRAAQVVPLSELDLRELIALESDPAALVVRDPTHEHVEVWLNAARDFDGPRLEQLFQSAWLELGPLGFLRERVGPFLFEVGAAWAERRLAIAHEHFASERLRDFMVSHWRPLSDRARGPIVLCATLPGESHVLGLHMIAIVFAVSGLRVVNIGADSPVGEVARTANNKRAAAVAISVSVAANRFVARTELAQLRDLLDDDIDLIIGGLGAPRGIPGVKHIDALDELVAWARLAS